MGLTVTGYIPPMVLSPHLKELIKVKEQERRERLSPQSILILEREGAAPPVPLTQHAARMSLCGTRHLLPVSL